jgi:preprotein translocase subunit YajC
VFFSLLLQYSIVRDPSILMMAACAFIFYFLILRPMQNQKKRTAQMLNELKAGDQVVTSGGIQGTITAVEKDTIIIRVKPDNLKLQFARSAVSALVPTEGSK